MTSKETFTHYQPLGNSDPARRIECESACNDSADA